MAAAVKGRVTAICLSRQRGTAKLPVAAAQAQADWGLVGDAHAGPWQRQVSLLSEEAAAAFAAQEGVELEAGAFGENLRLAGLDWSRLQVGSRLHSSRGVVLEVSQLGKDCHRGCAIAQRLGRCLMPKLGVFAWVRQGGSLRLGDEFSLEEPLSGEPLAAVVTVSDRSAAGSREDESGPTARRLLEAAGYRVAAARLVADEQEAISQVLLELADREGVGLIITSGGTGLSPRDVTPEATLQVAERSVPGLAEALRAYSLTKTPRAMLSRGVAVTRGRCLIINLPGSPKAVAEGLDYLLPVLGHALELLQGQVKDCGRA